MISNYNWLCNEKNKAEWFYIDVCIGKILRIISEYRYDLYSLVLFKKDFHNVYSLKNTCVLFIHTNELIEIPEFEVNNLILLSKLKEYFSFFSFNRNILRLKLIRTQVDSVLDLSNHKRFIRKIRVQNPNQ